MSERENSNGFGVGLLLGAVIGLAVGILYAPRSGKETRAFLKERFDETKDKAEEIVEEAKERAQRIVERAKGRAAELEEEQLGAV